MNYFKDNNRIDLDEDKLAQAKVDNTTLLDILLLDVTRKSQNIAIKQELISKNYRDTAQFNIIWATSGYGKKVNVPMYNDFDKIQPRWMKAKEDRSKRTKDKAEVFTPSWVCNKQANSIDRERFGKDVFNIEKDRGWETIKDKIPFTDNYKWTNYVKENVIEVTCGEAPYLVSRYDTVTGEWIDIKNRIGLLDRKIRVINENAEDDKEWLDQVKIAYQHTYGYEWQGDSLLLARENLLATFIDYYEDRFKKEINDINLLKEICEIISWNIWQMDGLKGVIPMSCESSCSPCKEVKKLFECINNTKSLWGNTKRNLHEGISCKIRNWETGKEEEFIECLG